MKFPWVFLVTLTLFASTLPRANAESSGPDVKITEVSESADLGGKDAGEKTSHTPREDEFTRPKNVSKYGTVSAIQAPLTWMGNALDGLVWTVGKIGSAAVSLVERPFESRKRKGEGGQHGEEKSKKA